MICQNDFFFLSQVTVVVNRRVQVKQHRQVNRLVWIEELVFEAEALDFVEIQGDLFREDLVDCNACDWFV